MDDDVSNSSDSIATSDEYEIVDQGEPQLQIAGNGSVDQLKISLKEVLGDSDSNCRMECGGGVPTQQEVSPHHPEVDKGKNPSQDSSSEGGGGGPVRGEMETFESVPDGTIGFKASSHVMSPNSPTDDGHFPKSASLQFPESEGLNFDRVIYLGCAAINAPRSELEIQRNMAILNDQSSDQAIEVSLAVPSHSEGTVMLYECSTNQEIASFPIYRILFCARGSQDCKEACCFAFTCSHGQTPESAIFQCHVFRCESSDSVTKVLHSFATAFRRVPRLPNSRSSSVSSVGTCVRNNEQVYVFEVSLDVKEEDTRGNYTSCAKDKDYLKFKCNLEKELQVTVQQSQNGKELVIERCFGMLISPGRHVKHSDMQLIGMVSMAKSQTGSEKTIYQITGHWNPNDPAFKVLNTEKNNGVYMTIAVDLVIAGIHEPVRFEIEAKAKIFPQNERFWYFREKRLHEQFFLHLREVDPEQVTKDHVFDVISINSATHMKRKAAMSLELDKSYKSSVPPEPSPPASSQEAESDLDEPLLSGTGEVSKDCTEDELEGWAIVLAKWRQNLNQRPKQLASLVRRGIPEALRGEAWQLLAGCNDDKVMFETYRILSTKDSPCESVIQRDINRTFPAHEFFRESGGLGQDSLYKICKAYSVHDPEVGYCQGLSFLAAALLLHMPEEQAFCVLSKIMYAYELRDLFRNSFEMLHVKLFQLERLIEDQLPELYAHFVDLGVEAHMYGSQWFLTLFTAKFPLYVVFYILDLFLLDGPDTVFQVAISLLMLSMKELLALDFEGVLKHFRVAVPKKYRSDETAKQLLKTAVSVKVKKLKKYEKEFQVKKEMEKQQEDPMERLKKESKRLLDSNMRLEQENDELAHELVTSKIQLRKDLDNAEDKVESLTKDVVTLKTSNSELEEEKRRLEEEVAQLKEMCRRELQRAESESTRSTSIISEYKQICSQLSVQLEKEQHRSKEKIEGLKMKIKDCEKCSSLIDSNLDNNTAVIVEDNQIDNQSHKHDFEKQIRELELELAKTKLALVEAECKNQDLTHQLNSAFAELQASKNTWFHKTLSSIRDATRKEAAAAREAKEKELP